MRRLMSGSWRLAIVAALSRAMISFGVPLGAHRPCQIETSIGKPASAAVGISGAAGERLGGHGIGPDLAGADLRQRVGRLVDHDLDLVGDRSCMAGPVPR